MSFLSCFPLFAKPGDRIGSLRPIRVVSFLPRDNFSCRKFSFSGEARWERDFRFFCALCCKDTPNCMEKRGGGNPLSPPLFPTHFPSPVIFFSSSSFFYDCRATPLPLTNEPPILGREGNRQIKFYCFKKDTFTDTQIIIFLGLQNKQKLVNSPPAI